MVTQCHQRVSLMPPAPRADFLRISIPIMSFLKSRREELLRIRCAEFGTVSVMMSF